MTILGRLAAPGFLLAAFLWLLSPVASAQPYPAKPVRIVCAFPAGGIADIYARIIGQRVTEAWGQPVVVGAVLDHDRLAPRLGHTLPDAWGQPVVGGDRAAGAGGRARLRQHT